MDILSSLKKIFAVVDKVRGALDPESAGGKKVTIPEGIGIGIEVLGLLPAYQDLGS